MKRVITAIVLIISILLSLTFPSYADSESSRQTSIETRLLSLERVTGVEEKSRELQELILDTDVLFMKNRDIIEPLYMDECLKNGMKIDSSYFGTETDDVAYEMAVMESNVQIWQYYQNFDELSEIKEMLETDPAGNAKKLPHIFMRTELEKTGAATAGSLPVSDGTLGACLLNGKTPDGYYVNEKGQWIH